MMRPVQLDLDRIKRARAVLNGAIDRRIFPGCVACVGIGDDLHWSAAMGRTSAEGAAVTVDTLYDLASLTKPLACAASILSLVERGALCLTDEVGPLFGPTARPHLRGVTVSHLLTHTSGLPPWERLYGRFETREEIVQSILVTPLDAKPGERYAYSDLGYILLGELIERMDGRRIDVFARDEIFMPMMLQEIGYFPISGDRPFTGQAEVGLADRSTRVAATSHCPHREGRELVAEVHDGNCAGLGGVSGHAGLFGSAGAVAACLQMLLRGGASARGRTIFGPMTVRLATSRRIPESVGGHTLGWFCPPNGMHTGGDLWSDRGFSHSGFTGTAAFADPATGIWVVLLTNSVYYSTGEFLRVRRAFHNSVAAAVLEAAGV